MTDWTVAWVHDLIHAFNAHEADAVGRLVTDDVAYSYWLDSAWTSLHGRERLLALVRSFDEEWSSDFVLRPTFAVVTEDGFAVEYDEKGTHDRGLSPSGQRFSLRNVMVGELRGRRISRMTDYSDVTAYRLQTSSKST